MSSRKSAIAFDLGESWRRRLRRMSTIVAGGEGWRIKALQQRGQLEREVGALWVGGRL